jgi:type IV pilus assembly protein PilV
MLGPYYVQNIAIMIIKVDALDDMPLCRWPLCRRIESRARCSASRCYAIKADNKAARAHRQKGFSLFEVLIALFILGIGVVGATSLQLAALRTTKHTSAQTSAVQMAVEIGERLRLSLNSATPMSDGDLSALVDYKSVEGEPVPAAGCYGRSCSVTEMASRDVYELKKRLYQEIPGGRVRICRDDTPWNTGTKTLDWNCSGGANAALVVKIGWPVKKPDGTVPSGSIGFPPLVAMTIAANVR